MFLKNINLIKFIIKKLAGRKIINRMYFLKFGT